MPLLQSTLRPSSSICALRTPPRIVITSAPRSHLLFTCQPSSSRKMSVSTKQEAAYKRNPHPDFKKVEESRPDWEQDSNFRYTKTADPSWTFGSGANALHDQDAAAGKKKHVCIDPYEPGRPSPFNYKLLISGIVPRPIGFVSTQSASGEQRNLAPFSYFNMMNHDPPMFVLGFASTLAAPKDTLRHLVDSRECVVNIIGEDFLEAANATSVDAPVGASEWEVSGLTPVADCVDVRPPRVREAVFSVECKLDTVREFDSRANPGAKSGCMVVVEGTRFWVREDALNDERSLIAPEVLRPISRLGGITYGRVTEAIEIPRPRFAEDVGGMEGYEKLKKQGGGRL
ncbi:hypothetical protein GGR54DRAFT_590972 [Hypoxylon sp. NC1633]|nr:hypothetical protein GGR54DRAFT_590972 [Hypoxylon sp. NC1633]